MKSAAVFLGVGPAEALEGAARRLQAPFDPAWLSGRFEEHASPRSLYAMIEIAREIGIDARAFQCGIEDLANVALPAVVHLKDPAKDESSFALLLERDADGLVLENPSRRQSGRLSRDEFLAFWTGVVVLLARKPEVAPHEPSRRAELLRTVRSAGRGDWPLTLAAGSAILLAGAGAVRLGISSGSVGLAACGLAGVGLVLVGVFVSATLFLASRRSRVPSATPRLASALCGRGRLADCEGVLSSRFSRIGGIELTSWGLAFFTSCLLLLAVSGVMGPEAGRGLYGWLAAAFLPAAFVSFALIGVQVWPLRRFCPLCMMVHAAVLGCAALGLPLLTRLESPGQAIFALAPMAILHAAAFLAALGLIVPFLEMGIENRMHRSRLAWISSTPWGALAEIAGRPPIDNALSPRIVVGAPGTVFRIDALVHPTCGGCPPVLEKLERLVARHPERVHVALHLPTRDPANDADRNLCAGLACIGLAAGGEQLLRVLEEVKRDPWKRLEAARAGASSIVAEFLAPEARAEEMLPLARESVAAADRLLEVLKRGTPTLMVGARPWDSPVEDLEALLSEHPSLLASAVGLRDALDPGSLCP